MPATVPHDNGNEEAQEEGDYRDLHLPEEGEHDGAHDDGEGVQEAGGLHLGRPLVEEGQGSHEVLLYGRRVTLRGRGWNVGEVIVINLM